MEKSKNKYSFISRRIAAASALGGVGIAILTGCTNPSGEGSEFDIIARVDHGGDNSLTVRVTQIKAANGDAADWFDETETHQIHDNCDCGSFGGNKTYGHVENLQGETVAPSTLPDGSCVEIEGKVHYYSQTVGKTTTYHHIPVYDVAREILC